MQAVHDFVIDAIKRLLAVLLVAPVLVFTLIVWAVAGVIAGLLHAVRFAAEQIERVKR